MSEVKVNKISPRTACGTVTLGDSGDTFTIPSGATITNSGTASGFGATGETSWDTTVKTTGTFTATAGVGYFLNTTGGIITVNLPVGAAGSSVAMADYAGTWQTNAVTVAANGTEKIGGVDADVTLSTVGQSVTFVYIDGTQGWVNVLDSTSNVRGNAFIIATGGTPCTGAISGDYKIHTFTGPGTLCVSDAGQPTGSNTVDYLVVAGGGGGGIGAVTGYCGGGGGAGGFRESVPSPAAWTASPIANPGNARPVTVQGYPITVGGGGAAACVAQQPGSSGANSIFSDITSTAGGGGAGEGPPNVALTGGSGGGGTNAALPNGGAGNTPPFSPAQGFSGGSGIGPPKNNTGGGGGGATELGQAGVFGTAPNPTGGRGGAGATTCISATPTAYAGGAGGSGSGSPGAASPCGTGGRGAKKPAPSTTAVAGTTNRGGGGGGGQSMPVAGAAGGSCVVIIRYIFQ